MNKILFEIPPRWMFVVEIKLKHQTTGVVNKFVHTLNSHKCRCLWDHISDLEVLHRATQHWVTKPQYSKPSFSSLVMPVVRAKKDFVRWG